MSTQKGYLPRRTVWQTKSVTDKIAPIIIFAKNTPNSLFIQKLTLSFSETKTEYVHDVTSKFINNKFEKEAHYKNANYKPTCSNPKSHTAFRRQHELRVSHQKRRAQMSNHNI